MIVSKYNSLKEESSLNYTPELYTQKTTKEEYENVTRIRKTFSTTAIIDRFRYLLPSSATNLCASNNSVQTN